MIDLSIYLYVCLSVSLSISAKITKPLDVGVKESANRVSFSGGSPPLQKLKEETEREEGMGGSWTKEREI